MFNKQQFVPKDLFRKSVHLFRRSVHFQGFLPNDVFPVHSATLLYKNADQNLRFCTKRQKRRFFSDLVDSVNSEKRIFVSTTALVKDYKNRDGYFSSIAVSSVSPKNGYFYLDFCTETEQCERLSNICKNGLVHTRSSVNPALHVFL